MNELVFHVLSAVLSAAVLGIVGYIVHLISRVAALEMRAATTEATTTALAQSKEKVEDDKAARLAEALTALTDYGKLMAKVEVILQSTDRRLQLLEDFIFRPGEKT